MVTKTDTFGSSLPSRNESSVQATGAAFLFNYVG